MTIDEVLKEWEVDARIDENKLDQTSIDNALLHGKYLRYYTDASFALKKVNLDLAILKRDLWLYYHGKMHKDDLDKRGWEYDPFNGMAKPLKSDMKLFMDADPRMIKALAKVEYQQKLVDAIKEIMDTIKWRHQTIKNIIAHKQFLAGN